MITSGALDGARCWRCQRGMDVAMHVSGPSETAEVAPGAVAMCGYCDAVSVVDTDGDTLTLRPPSMDDELYAEETIVGFLLIRATVSSGVMPNPCPECDEMVLGTRPNAGRGPRTGDRVKCGGCGTWLTHNHVLALEKLSEVPVLGNPPKEGM